MSVVLHNTLGDSQWNDIEQAGNDLKAKISGLGPVVVLMDLSRLEFMGSSIVALVVKTWKVIESQQGGMVVLSSNEMTKEVLEIAGLNKLWPVVASRAEAEEILSRPPYAPATRISTFLLMTLGWVAAAGSVGAVVVLKRELETFEPQTARLIAAGCSGLAAWIGLIAILRERRIWRFLGVLLLLVAVSLAGAAAM